MTRFPHAVARMPPPPWVGYQAAAWSLLYGALGLFWALGGAGFPFGENDPRAEDGMSLLIGLSAKDGGAAIAVLGLAGAGVGVAMGSPEGRRAPRAVLQAFAWGACALLLLVVPDARLLQNLAYALLLRFDRVDWPVVNQLLCVAGGLAWGAAAVVYGRRGNIGGDWTTPAAAARWGRWATLIAVVAPLPYGIVRLAWSLGIPLGVSEEFVVALNQDAAAKGIGFAKYVFGGEAIVGALLTLGLVQRWGEIFPRWLPLLGGRRAPIWLAVVPASLVAIVVTVAGRVVVSDIVLDGGVDLDQWGLAGPALLWPVWGIALGGATLAYWLRRRGECWRRDHATPEVAPAKALRSTTLSALTPLTETRSRAGYTDPAP